MISEDYPEVLRAQIAAERALEANGLTVHARRIREAETIVHVLAAVAPAWLVVSEGMEMMRAAGLRSHQMTLAWEAYSACQRLTGEATSARRAA